MLRSVSAVTLSVHTLNRGDQEGVGEWREGQVGSQRTKKERRKFPPVNSYSIVSLEAICQAKRYSVKRKPKASEELARADFGDPVHVKNKEGATFGEEKIKQLSKCFTSLVWAKCLMTLACFSSWGITRSTFSL
jgi:ferredoxin-NADP reductase